MSNVIVHPHPEPGTLPVTQTHHFGRYLLVTALMLLFGGLIWMIVAFKSRSFQDADAQRADQRYKIYGDVMQADDKALNSPPSILNKEQGKIRLPLADAINLTLRDINANKPRAAYPVQPTNPAPNPAPEASVAPTPAPVAQPPNTVNANNPVLPKPADSPAPSTPSGPAPSADSNLSPKPADSPAPSDPADIEPSPGPRPSPAEESADPR